jgi:RNA polymerase sigma-70 factor, ECF subfamily
MVRANPSYWRHRVLAYAIPAVTGSWRLDPSDRARDFVGTRMRRGPPAGMRSEEPADLELLRRMQRGDESALETLYARYGGLVFTLALRIVGDPELAREVLQDTFLRSWDGRETYDSGRGRVPWWLMGIARNRAIDVLRSRPHRARMREQAATPSRAHEAEPAVPGAAEATALRRTVTQALAGLSEVQREAIELAYYRGLTQVEIARYLGQPLGTVKSRIRDAMERLRTLLESLIEPTEDLESRRD